MDEKNDNLDDSSGKKSINDNNISSDKKIRALEKKYNTKRDNIGYKEVIGVAHDLGSAISALENDRKEDFTFLLVATLEYITSSEMNKCKNLEQHVCGHLERLTFNTCGKVIGKKIKPTTSESSNDFALYHAKRDDRSDNLKTE